ncbi:HET-domain-containing protein, partial [Cadophora sp. DSE1049]
RYAALSHCWGIVPTLTTTLTNLEALSRKITMAQIPRTFQDAIKISKRLGFEYLWIDSLCIIQDSEEDWLKESVKMIEYYRNAYLTISVLDSPDSHHGILNSRDYIPSAKLSSEANLYLREKLREQREVLKDALLSSRAWALQERLLSTRILHYSSKEMFWECQTCSARESSTEEISGGVDPDSVTVSEGDDFKRILSYISQTTSAAQKMQVMSTWYRIVTQYSRKDLTRDSDKLPAISGIASAVKEITGYTYLAGIWGEDPKGLLWFSDGSLTPNTAYRGPSWSWASY